MSDAARWMFALIAFQTLLAQGTSTLSFLSATQIDVTLP